MGRGTTQSEDAPSMRVEAPASDAPSAESSAGRPSRSSRERVETLRALIDPVVSREGYELVDVEWASDRGGPIVRVYIDTIPPSDETRGVGIDDCTLVSRRVGEALDAADPVEGEYRLEVSSPGVFRPLTKPEHFDRALGARVKIRTHAKVEGRRVFVGILLRRREDRLDVEVDGRDFEVPLASLAKANLEPLI